MNGPQTVATPPAAAVRATLADRAVDVRLEFSQELPRSCRPTLVNVAIDATTDTAPGFWEQVPLRGRLRRVARIPIPEYFTARPDSLTARAVGSNGASGPAARVQIP